MIQVSRLRVLCELHRRGTLAAVAEALVYSPSAVSQQLRQLEREVGAPLIEPAGRGVSITEQGLILVKLGNQIFRLIEHAEAELDASLTEVRGTLRVAAFQTAALTLLPIAINDLKQRYPLVKIEFTEAEPESALPALVSSEFDLVIVESYPGYPPPIVEGVHVAHLMNDPLWLAMDHITASQLDPARDPVSQLAEAGWAIELDRSVPAMWLSDRCRRSGFEPVIACRSEDLVVQRQLVVSGLAVAVLPGLALLDIGKELTLFPTGEGLDHREILMATRSSSQGKLAVDALRESLHNAAASVAGAVDFPSPRAY